jgi:hypothetical protein
MTPTLASLASPAFNAPAPEVLDRPRCAYPSLATDDKNLPGVAFWADAELPQPVLRLMRKTAGGVWQTDTVPGASGLHTALAFTAFGDPVLPGMTPLPARSRPPSSTTARGARKSRPPESPGSSPENCP